MDGKQEGMKQDQPCPLWVKGVPLDKLQLTCSINLYRVEIYPTMMNNTKEAGNFLFDGRYERIGVWIYTVELGHDVQRSGIIHPFIPEYIFKLYGVRQLGYSH